jgi:hypothetical protein
MTEPISLPPGPIFCPIAQTVPVAARMGCIDIAFAS